MNLRRILAHLFTTRTQVRRAFPARSIDAIEAAIRASEAAHSGEICFAVEGGLDGLPLFRGQQARERAIELFAQLRVWDTERNNGLLVYILLADRAVEIVADRGISARVAPDEWRTVCDQMTKSLVASHFEQAAIDGVRAVAQHLARHFPAAPADAGRPNELSDRPLIL